VTGDRPVHSPSCCSVFGVAVLTAVGGVTLAVTILLTRKRIQYGGDIDVDHSSVISSLVMLFDEEDKEEKGAAWQH